MRQMKERLDRLEKAITPADQPISNIREATDAQLECILRSNGIDPDNENELKEAARWIK